MPVSALIAALVLYLFLNFCWYMLASFFMTLELINTFYQNATFLFIKRAKKLDLLHFNFLNLKILATFLRTKCSVILFLPLVHTWHTKKCFTRSGAPTGVFDKLITDWTSHFLLLVSIFYPIFWQHEVKYSFLILFVLGVIFSI